MGQSLCCLSCGNRNTKVMPLRTLPNALNYSSFALMTPRIPSFHRPVRSSLERLSTEISNPSSLATISLGSEQALSSVKGESIANNNETTTEDNQESSPSSKRHPGLLTPEPDENLLNSAFSPGEAAQGCGSLLPQMIGGKQSHVEQLFAVGATMARVPTPRPSDAGVIMVKPYQGSSASIPEETEHVCKHGIPLTGVTGDPHEVNCVRCERPTSRGGRVLAGMMAFRQAQRKLGKKKRVLNRQRLKEEQEKRKKIKEEYDNALRQFAERQQKNN